MTKREEVIRFCQHNGLRARGYRKAGGGVCLSYDTKRTSMADWVDCFDNWDDAHTFLLSAVNAHNYDGKPYPWLR